jgi:cytochrome c biogenesis protein CcmG/thiol:disulfide interchange protein DsbE
MRLAFALGALLVTAVPVAAAPAAPAFTVKLIEGSGHFDSRAHLGKNVLIVRFQASWCKVCNEEAAGYERIYRKYRASGVEMVSVQVQDTEADARRFLQINKVSYPAGLDPRLKIANRFGFRGTPYTVIINKGGEMVARIHGRTDEARIARILDALLQRGSKGSGPPGTRPTAPPRTPPRTPKVPAPKPPAPSR